MPLTFPLHLGSSRRRQGGEILFCPEELAGWPILEGESAYENRFGNITGRGRYRGVLVRELLDRLGGMEPEDVLVVHADDGYAQEFAYANVYPGHLGWEEIQGEMILAFAYEGLEPPDWQEGCRIAFLPPDGIYHNDDCASTSVPGQGWHLDPSAGARWVKTWFGWRWFPNEGFCQSGFARDRHPERHRRGHEHLHRVSGQLAQQSPGGPLRSRSVCRGAPRFLAGPGAGLVGRPGAAS